MREKELEKLKDYKYGFSTDIENFKAPKGLNEDVIKFISNIKKDSSIWVFEVLKYDEVNYNIENNSLNLTHESSEDLNLSERFSFSVLLKK